MTAGNRFGVLLASLTALVAEEELLGIPQRHVGEASGLEVADGELGAGPGGGG